MAKPKTERFELRLRPEDKEALRMASEFTQGGDIAELVRGSARLVAHSLISQNMGGDLNIIYALSDYLRLLASLSSETISTRLPKYRIKVSVLGEDGEEIGSEAVYTLWENGSIFTHGKGAE